MSKGTTDQFTFVNAAIREHFGDKLVALVIFGSSVTSQAFSATSDLDYIVILDRDVPDQDALSRKLKKSLGDKFALLAFNIYARDTFIETLAKNPWLVLSVKLGYHVIYDESHFFEDNLNGASKKVNALQIAPFGWTIESPPTNTSLMSHLIYLSDRMLVSSGMLFRESLYDTAIMLLCESMHSFLSYHLLRRNIFMTRGEVVQCFIKSVPIANADHFRDELLEIEQVAGKLDKISFDFTGDGEMSFMNGNAVFLKDFYERKAKVFGELKEQF